MAHRNPELVQRIKAMPCFICGHPPPSDPCHITTRKLVGDQPFNLIPMCRDHHMEQHRIGIKSFVDRYRLPIDISGIYPRLEFEWKL